VVEHADGSREVIVTDATGTFVVHLSGKPAHPGATVMAGTTWNKSTPDKYPMAGTNRATLTR